MKIRNQNIFASLTCLNIMLVNRPMSVPPESYEVPNGEKEERHKFGLKKGPHLIRSYVYYFLDRADLNPF